MGAYLSSKLARAVPCETMRAPGAGPLGWLARTLMKRNRAVSDDAVASLDLSAGKNILELGPGNGDALRALLSTRPNAVHAVEISDRFRASLRSEFSTDIASGTLSVTGGDARALPLPDASVDACLGVNVVYFLDPLPCYLRELRRVLKPGGKILWACRGGAVPGAEEIYVNCCWSEVAAEMEAAGFEARVGAERRLPGRAWTPIVGVKA